MIGLRVEVSRKKWRKNLFLIEPKFDYVKIV